MPDIQSTPSNNLQVAIVILTWNGLHHLQKFLPSVVRSTYQKLEIFVADNASTDETIPFLQKNYPQIKIISLPENYGYAGGYNRTLAQIDADVFILLNSDVKVTPGWIEPVIELMISDENIAACQPKLLMFDNKELFECAGACGGWIDVLGYPFARGRVFDDVEKDAGQYNVTAPCFWASGAALFVRSKAFKDAGGFDDFFFAHQEEIDLCWRLQNMGYKIYCEPRSVVYHVGGGTLPKTNSRKTFLNFRNNLLMIFKNSSPASLLWKLPVRFILDWLAALQFLKKDKTLAKAVLLAHTAFLKRIFSPQFKRSRGNKPLAGIYKGSLVWQYFINKRKTFVEIVKES